RLWSLHPKYLDRMGLLAVWREGLLARKVLAGETKGYRNHPQLERFKATRNPVKSVSWYLKKIAEEASQRGYRFNTEKLGMARKPETIPVEKGQISYEFNHLLNKLQIRDPERYNAFRNAGVIQLHPLFQEIAGSVATWERVSG
ncbi:MAG: hypothetical protein JW863_10465, partial [Chitinispirillaceae bacterium]|nr:hypothetical protein [Chitinispirillaceae bacterium]